MEIPEGGEPMREQGSDPVLDQEIPVQVIPERSQELFRRLLESLPAPAYICDPDGLVTFYNRHALEAWGRAPKLRDPADRYCGSFRLFAADGAPVAHSACGLARALREDRHHNRE